MRPNIFVLLTGVALCLLPTVVKAQGYRWQQSANYRMEVDFNVQKHTYAGRQWVVLTNNSPDTLTQVFYHLYFNAFQPGSAMDVRSRWLPDSDQRVGGRISTLKPDEQGYLHVSSLRHNGQEVRFTEEGTILEVQLAQPVLPGQKAEFAMDFRGQVPVQIRRSGRYSAEGIAYSMAQWYPKMCNYDEQGWHANPYIAREFYGIWGDFDVTITIDKNYVVAATGYLQQPETIGHGYAEGAQPRPVDGKLRWQFKAPKVHDFVWAADPDYKHTSFRRADGTLLRFFYQPGPKTNDNWEALPAIMDKAMDFINKTYGPYPYKEYAFIQGGDGGMEYPMATLITGERTLVSLVGVAVHELMHSWFQMVLASNESLYAWMDEGFTSYASNEVMNYLRQQKLIPGNAMENPHAGANASHIAFTQTGKAEPISIHADHFQSNAAYGVGAYVKGEVFLHQLKYILGQQAFDQAMLRYYHDWSFRHPNANDFVRVMEKTGGLELDWYKEYMLYTTHLSDYEIVTARDGDERKQSTIELRRKGLMPMPVDLVITLRDDSKLYYTIPLDLMRGAKQQDGTVSWTVAPDWTWTNESYSLELPVKLNRIISVEIDPSLRLVDANRENNKLIIKE